MTLKSFFFSILTLVSNFFPPLTTESVAQVESKEEPPADLEQSTEPSELLSQLPDAPTTDLQDDETAKQPSLKRQKTAEAEDDFVVIEKEDASEEKPKADL